LAPKMPRGIKRTSLFDGCSPYCIDPDTTHVRLL
jgi:hypothetical protein